MSKEKFIQFLILFKYKQKLYNRIYKQKLKNHGDQ